MVSRSKDNETSWLGEAATSSRSACRIVIESITRHHFAGTSFDLEEKASAALRGLRSGWDLDRIARSSALSTLYLVDGTATE
jgi:hypothetical protein